MLTELGRERLALGRNLVATNPTVADALGQAVDARFGTGRQRRELARLAAQHQYFVAGPRLFALKLGERLGFGQGVGLARALLARKLVDARLEVRLFGLEAHHARAD